MNVYLSYDLLEIIFGINSYLSDFQDDNVNTCNLLTSFLVKLAVFFLVTFYPFFPIFYSSFVIHPSSYTPFINT